MPSLFAAQNPAGVATTWSQACNFWRHSTSTCPSLLRLDCDAASSSFVAVKGGFLGGTLIGHQQAGSSPYVPALFQRGMIIEVWKALADGQWSSSIAIELWSVRISGPSNTTFRAVPHSAASPAAIDATVFVGAGTVIHVGTVTVMDDGTFTVTFI